VGNHPKLAGIDLDRSFILGVIYDDESLTLEMDFLLLPDHAKYRDPAAGEQNCFNKGFVRFSDMDDLRLRKTKVPEGEQIDLSVIKTATIDADYAFIDSGWGEIELTARSIQIAFD
jgi:hypothetical protein